MDLKSQPLTGRFVRLEPLADAHREPLRAACAADPDIWAQLYPVSLVGEHYDAWWTRVWAEMAEGRTIVFAVMAEKACIGVTCFLQIDPANRAVEIGSTYYRPEARGGPVNPQAKRLLLAHAFEAGAIRVYLKVDAINTRSRAAVLKLGAVQEGILRQDRIVWTGRVRDTVHFSILASEWPGVRDRLDARLAGFG